MKTRRLLLVLMTLLVSGPNNFADVGPVKLETLIDGVDIIVVGRIIDVKVLASGFKLAEVEITQTVRGQQPGSKLY